MEDSILQKSKPHVAMFPSPGMGHLIPFCELARRLASDFSCKVTLILFKEFSASPQASSVISAIADRNLQIDIVYIPDVEFQQSGNQNTALLARICAITEKSFNKVLQVLSSAAIPVSAMVVDLFCCALISRVQIPTYIFFTSSAASPIFVFAFPTLLKQFAVPLKEVDFGIKFPGLPAILTRDMPTEVLEPSAPVFQEILKLSTDVHGAAGVFIDTFEELESEAIESFRLKWKCVLPQVYAVGPMIFRQLRTDFPALKWLDHQPPSSVVFVCFGSAAVLPVDQLAEIAAGLEASGQRFIWVVREMKSGQSSVSSAYFGLRETGDVGELLPQGFMERTKERGILVARWAPQFTILSHSSVGGFVSHCGWNSTIESIFCGVPMITWPMFAEQKMNAIMIKEAYGVGVDLKIESGGFVKGCEVERSVRELMEGEMGRKARERAKELMTKARKAVEEGGTSWNAMADAVRQLH